MDNNNQKILSGIDPKIMKASLAQALAETKRDQTEQNTGGKLPEGRYVGTVVLSVSDVKDGINKGRHKITFALRASEGSHKGGRAWHHRVITPQQLETASEEKQNQYYLQTWKMLITCGIPIEGNETWEEAIVKIQNIGNRTNKVKFNVKPSANKPDELTPYIDGVHEYYDGSNSMFSNPIGAGDGLPDGKDYPG